MRLCEETEVRVNGLDITVRRAGLTHLHIYIPVSDSDGKIVVSPHPMRGNREALEIARKVVEMLAQ